MNKKKGLLLFGFIFIISLFFINFISASPLYDARRGMSDLIDTVVEFSEPALQVLLGGYDYTGWLLFERAMIFVLILSIVYLSLKQVPIFDGEGQKGVLWIVSVIIPLLAVRGINYEWLNTILMSYQVLGVALTGILPFVIFLFFLHNALTDYATARKIGWIFFMVVYFGLWATTESPNYGQIYLWTIFISLIFLLLDGTIHMALEFQRLKSGGRVGLIEELGKVRDRREKAEGMSLDPRRKKELVRNLDRDIRRLEKEIAKGQY